jgi:hypothetical protein
VVSSSRYQTTATGPHSSATHRSRQPCIRNGCLLRKVELTSRSIDRGRLWDGVRLG